MGFDPDELDYSLARKLGSNMDVRMILGLPVALMFLAEGPSIASQHAYGPAAAPSPKQAAIPSKPAECSPTAPDPNSREIVVCAVKPDGYRLPPDVVEARRLKKQGGRRAQPHNPHETYADHSCANVGPMGCRGTPAVDLLAAAAVAMQIGERLAKGQEVGSILETDRQSGEYRLYLEAKHQREEKEAEAKAKAVQAEAAAKAKASER
jgi:hypothetical protein